YELGRGRRRPGVGRGLRADAGAHRRDLASGLRMKHNLSMHNSAVAAVADNPLLGSWQGPFGGGPPFDTGRVSDFKPALETAMAENLAEIAAICSNPAAASFDNTILALERSGRMLNRVMAIYAVWSSTMSTAEFQAIEREMQPRLAAFSDRI